MYTPSSSVQALRGAEWEFSLLVNLLKLVDQRTNQQALLRSANAKDAATSSSSLKKPPAVAMEHIDIYQEAADEEVVSAAASAKKALAIQTCLGLKMDYLIGELWQQ